MVGQQVVEEWPMHLHLESPADESLVQAMLDYLNTGGEIGRARALSSGILTLKDIAFAGFELVGVDNDCPRTLFYKREADNEIFRVEVGLYAQRVPPDQYDALAEEYGVVINDPATANATADAGAEVQSQKCLPAPGSVSE